MLNKESNPYEVLNVDAEPLVGDPTSPHWYTVEGELLVCGSNVILPDVCIFTNSRHDLVANSIQAQYPSFRPVIVQRACFITYFTTRAQRRRRRLISALTIGGIVVSILLILIGSGTDSNELLLSGFVLTSISFVARMLLAMIYGLNLRIASYKRPGIFRIRGFPKSYLGILAQEHLHKTDHTPE